MIMTHKYKFFRGDIKEFKTWLESLDKTSDKYKDIYNSIVWIHPSIGEIDTTSDRGWIYVHGVYFNSDTMSVADGRVYINGMDVDGSAKQYKLLNSSDIDNIESQDVKEGVVNGSLLVDYIDHRLQWEIEG